MAKTLQECLQALIDSSESARPKGSVRFKPSQEQHGAVQSGEKRVCESAAMQCKIPRRAVLPSVPPTRTQHMTVHMLLEASSDE